MDPFLHIVHSMCKLKGSNKCSISFLAFFCWGAKVLQLTVAKLESEKLPDNEKDYVLLIGMSWINIVFWALQSNTIIGVKLYFLLLRIVILLFFLEKKKF